MLMQHHLSRLGLSEGMKHPVALHGSYSLAWNFIRLLHGKMNYMRWKRLHAENRSTSDGLLSVGFFIKDGLCAERGWQPVQCPTDVFWRRWKLEYLTLLREHQSRLSDSAPVEFGDLMLVVRILLPKLGPMEETFSGADGEMRKSPILFIYHIVSTNCKNNSIEWN